MFGNQSRRVVDGFATKGFRGTSASILSAVDANSDHRCVALRAEEVQAAPLRFARGPPRWHPWAPSTRQTADINARVAQANAGISDIQEALAFMSDTIRQGE